MRLVAAVALLCLPQEGGRIALDRTGSIGDVAQALSEACGATVEVLEGVDPKAISVKLDHATFYEALDAVCRAHGNARYTDPPRGPEEGLVEIRPGPWVDYPSCYAQDFKIVVSEWAGFTSAGLVGEQRWNRVYLSVFGPPWSRIQETTASKAAWALEQALDADGQDVLPPARDREPAQAIDLVWHGRFTKGNVASRVFRLRPFDPDRGLQLLKGTVQVSVASTKEVEVPLAAGKSVETPAGTLSVDAVRDPQTTSRGKLWRVAFTLKEPRRVAGLRQAFEGRFRCDGEGLRGRVFLLTFPKEGFSFEAVIRGAEALPGSIRIMAREGERRETFPFEFRNLKF